MALCSGTTAAQNNSIDNSSTVPPSNENNDFVDLFTGISIRDIIILSVVVCLALAGMCVMIAQRNQSRRRLQAVQRTDVELAQQALDRQSMPSLPDQEIR